MLFSLTALLLFPLISGAQVKVLFGGNVGIGTTSPGTGILSSPNKVLDLKGTGLTGYVLHGGTSGQETCLSTNGIGTYFDIAGHSTASNNFLAFRTSNTGGSISVAERMRITSAGNVGIGVPVPLQTLDVNGRIYLRNGVIQKGGATGITGTSDLGLYSYDASFMRFVTNSQPIHFFVDGGTGGIGTTPKMTVAANGSVGVSNQYPSASYKLDVGGNLNINGTGTCNGGAWSSDQQFKTNVDSISNALSLINQLKPRSFYFDTTNVYGLNFSNLKQYGLIAQDVEQLLPGLVTSSTKPADVDTLGNVIHPSVTYKSLNYNAFIGIMLQGIKEQSSKVDSLAEELLTEKTKTNNQDSIINSLQNQMNQSITNNTSLQNQLNALASTINSCCDDKHDNGNHNGHQKVANNHTNVELNDAQTIVLEQNVPNPFAEQTAINYTLPENTVKAQMLFYNAQGKLIQSTELTQKGKGTLNVFASDLSSGIYTYTLVVDDKIIEKKKMVKQ